GLVRALCAGRKQFSSQSRHPRERRSKLVDRSGSRHYSQRRSRSADLKYHDDERESERCSGYRTFRRDFDGNARDHGIIARVHRALRRHGLFSEPSDGSHRVACCAWRTTETYPRVDYGPRHEADFVRRGYWINSSLEHDTAAGQFAFQLKHDRRCYVQRHLSSSWPNWVTCLLSAGTRCHAAEPDGGATL